MHFQDRTGLGKDHSHSHLTDLKAIPRQEVKAKPFFINCLKFKVAPSYRDLLCKRWKARLLRQFSDQSTPDSLNYSDSSEL